MQVTRIDGRYQPRFVVQVQKSLLLKRQVHYSSPPPRSRAHVKWRWSVRGKSDKRAIAACYLSIMAQSKQASMVQ